MTTASVEPRRGRLRVASSLVRDERFKRLSLADLRVVRQVLIDEVERAAYWRRVLGVRVGTAQLSRSPLMSVEEVKAALADAGRSAARLSLVPGRPGEPVQLPDLVGLYARAVASGDAALTADLGAELWDADTALSDYRAELQEWEHAATTEMLVRYREAPRLALLLLPRVDDPYTSRREPLALDEDHEDHEDRGIRHSRRAG